MTALRHVFGGARRIALVRGLLLALGLLAGARPALAQQATAESLGWLAGCWQASRGATTIEEQWTPPRGGTLLGTSRTVQGDSLLGYEFLRIHAAADGLVLTAAPSGQQPASFPLTAHGPGFAEFANPAHDFPQRIRYRAHGADSLVAEIEGPGREGVRRIRFPYRRTACAARASAPLHESHQLLVVTSTHWDSITGELRRFVRADADAPWQPVGEALPVVLGRRGMAWGVGFDSLATAQLAGARKHEGDGRSPAGVFPVGTAFGFPPPDSLAGVRLPYQRLTPATECIDDTASAHYNAVLERDLAATVDWSSSERMREISVYRLGVIVDYNVRPTTHGRGSCIFLHIWKGPRSPTAGCTAMAVNGLEDLVGWLDPAAHPLLVQLPIGAYRALQPTWNLPPLDRP